MRGNTLFHLLVFANEYSKHLKISLALNFRVVYILIMNYVLILLFIGPQGSTIESIDFRTLEACITAGETLSIEWPIKYKCMEK
jgi:hypothetical protein